MMLHETNEYKPKPGMGGGGGCAPLGLKVDMRPAMVFRDCFGLNFLSRVPKIRTLSEKWGEIFYLKHGQG